MKAHRLASRGLLPGTVISAESDAFYRRPQSDDPGDNLSG
jgi:hypothetical protein